MKADRDVTRIVAKPIIKAAKVLIPKPMATTTAVNGKINKLISFYPP